MALDREGLGESGRLVGPYIVQLFDEVERLGQLAGLNSVPVPLSSNSPGEKGQMAIGENYLYVCVSKDRWKRVALTSNF